jgi:MOSC domain-containing protein YiiM
MSRAGTVVALQLCPGHRLPMASRSEVRAVAGIGLEGDFHARGGRRQVLLIDLEILDSLGLKPGQVKENLTVRGLNLQGLPAGTRLRVGAEVVLELTGPCTPCVRMDEIRPGLQAELQGRRGVLARVVAGGTIRVGDPVSPLEESAG